MIEHKTHQTYVHYLKNDPNAHVYFKQIKKVVLIVFILVKFSLFNLHITIAKWMFSRG